MSYSCPTLQDTMTAAYGRWQANREMSQKDFLASLSAKESFAVRVGNLNYQVENGGFSQYWGNSYARHGSLAAVREICRWLVTFASDRSEEEQKAAAKVLELVGKFTEIMGHNLDPQGRLTLPDNSRSRRGRYSYIDDEESQEDVETILLERLESAKLDSQFYAVNDDWMNLAEAYIVATFK